MNRVNAVALSSSILLALGAVASAQCGTESSLAAGSSPAIVPASYQPRSAARDIVDTAVASGNFKTLAAALKAAGLVDALKGEGPFTVFAPTDEAFAKLPAGTVENLLKPENKALLTSILKYHVVPGRADAAAVTGMSSAVTLAGQRVDLGVRGGKVRLDERAWVTTADLACTNGIIHVIDTVIMPETKNVVQKAEEAGSFSTLLAAVKAAGLDGALAGEGPFTIFAPTDEAFAKLPAGTVQNLLKPENKAALAAILKFHVVPARVYADQVLTMGQGPATLQGSPFRIGLTIGNAKGMANIISTDLEGSNGVIHVIDSVIMPE